MKASSFQVRIALSSMDEAVQDAQLLSVVKGLKTHFPEAFSGNLSPEEQIRLRVEGIDPTGNKIYASWLLSSLAKAVKIRKQSYWISENPEKALEQGVVPFDPHTEGETIKDKVKNSVVAELTRMNIQLRRALWIEWPAADRADLRKAMEKHSSIMQIPGAADYFSVKHVDSYGSARSLVDDMEKVEPSEYVSKRKVKKGSGNPLAIPGSSQVLSDDNFVVFQADTPEASTFHAAATSWCVKDKSWSSRYLDNGPLFFIYVVKGSQAFTQIGEGKTLGTSDPHLRRWVLVSFNSPDARMIPEAIRNAVHNKPDGIYFEARNLENEELSPSVATKTGLISVLDDLLKIAKEGRSPETGYGYGWYRSISKYGSGLATFWRWNGSIPPDALTSDGKFNVSSVFTKKRLGVVGPMNLYALHKKFPNLISPEGVIQLPSSDEDSTEMKGFWNTLYSAANGAIIDRETYLKAFAAAKERAIENYWLRPVVTRLLDSVDSRVSDEEFAGHRGPVYILGVPAAQWREAIRNNFTVSVLKELLNGRYSHYVEGDATTPRLYAEEFVASIPWVDLARYIGLQLPAQEPTESADPRRAIRSVFGRRSR